MCSLRIELHSKKVYYIDSSRERETHSPSRQDAKGTHAALQKKIKITEDNTMSKNEMITMIETMNNYDDLAAKAKAKADAIREAIKEEMVRQDTEELVAGAYIVRFTSVISNRFDSTTFKRLYADLYKDFTKPVSSRRFSVSC